MNLFDADNVDEPQSIPPSDTPAVLQFLCPPEAIVSDCTSVTAVVTSLDSRGVGYFRDIVSRQTARQKFLAELEQQVGNADGHGIDIDASAGSACA